MVKNKKIIEVCDIILIDKNNKFLVQLRDDKENIYGPGKWGLFGGRKKNNETPEECIIREIKEELSIKLNKPKLVNMLKDDGGNQIFKHYIFFDCINKKTSDLKLNEGEKVAFYNSEDIECLDKVKWFNNLFLNILKKYANYKSNIK